MNRYILRRLAQALPSLFVAAVVVFVILHLLPGNVAQVLAGVDASRQDVSAAEAKFGLNRSLISQFGSWVKDLLHGQLGTSYVTGQPVAHMIAQAFPVTLFLAIGGVLVAVIIGIPVGMLSAVRRGRPTDRTVMGLTLLGVSIPNFVLAIGLVYLFAVRLRWLPASGWVPFDVSPWNAVRSLILPSVSLGALYAANIARTARNALISALAEDHIATERSLGISEIRVRYVHALKNALGPVLTVAGLTFGGLLGGTVVIEKLFNLPGVGTMVIDGVTRRDYPVVQGVVLLLAATYVLVNLGVDLLYGLIDPRIRLGRGSGG